MSSPTVWTGTADLDVDRRTVGAGGVPARSLRTSQGDETAALLHSTSGHLEALVRTLQAHGRHHRCHAIDVLGHEQAARYDELSLVLLAKRTGR